MTEGYTGDCYMCAIENLDDICDTLIKKGCNILDVVPIEYYNNGVTITATRMCITYERPKNPIE